MAPLLTVADMMVVHDEVLAALGGEGGIRRRGLLDDLLRRSSTGKDTTDQAAILLHGLATLRPLAAANLRTGFVVADLLLGMMGYRIEADLPEAQELRALVENPLADVSAVSTWLRKHVHPRVREA